MFTVDRGDVQSELKVDHVVEIESEGEESSEDKGTKLSMSTIAISMMEAVILKTWCVTAGAQESMEK